MDNKISSRCNSLSLCGSKKARMFCISTFPKGEELTESQFDDAKDSLNSYTLRLTPPINYSIFTNAEVIVPSKLWNTCICETLAHPYIEEAKTNTATYKAIPKEETEKRYKYAKSVLLHSLSEIYSYLGGDSIEYQTLNNQVVKETLQCAIDYYNGSQEPDGIAREVEYYISTTTVPSYGHY